MLFRARSRALLDLAVFGCFSNEENCDNLGKMKSVGSVLLMEEILHQLI